MAWFDTARFGMFVHWGHSSQQGIELSWPLVGGVFALPSSTSVPVGQYHASATTFDPTAWDPRGLARRAKRMGMQYGVITAKHHDGYAMYHTKQSDYSIEHSPFKRDIVREFLDAFRAEGMHAGIYYSLIDWHHQDYPAFTEADKPYVFGRWRRPTTEGWARLSKFMFEQVRELLTNYGKLDVIWFDGGWERKAEQWRSAELVEMVRSLQPEILINDRLPGEGDFDTPEQFVPNKPPDRAWEICLTINDSWGFNVTDTNWKSPRRLIHTICEVAGKGGNLLLNVGPRGDGSLQPEVAERLGSVELWMARHRESIVGTAPGLAPWQWYGPSTRRGDTVYLHALMRPEEFVTVRGVPTRRLRSVRSVTTGQDLSYETRTTVVDMINPDPDGEVTIQVPDAAVDSYASVFALDFAKASQ